MQYSEQVASAIAEGIVMALNRAARDNNRLMDTKLKNFIFTGENIKPLSITNAHIREGSIEIAKIKNLSAEVANLVVANIENATIDTAQIRDLSAYVADITLATIQTADIQWAEIASLTAAVADMTIANVKNARIDFAQIDGLVAGQALITEAVGGKVAIADLAVTDANIVSINADKISAGTISVERLVIVGQEKSIVYAINEANGTTELSQTTIDGGSITRKSITADQIVAQGITADCLNVQEIFANEALIGVITTANLDADEITSNEAFIGKLTTSMIASPEFGGLDLVSKEYVKSEVAKASKNQTFIQNSEPQGEFDIGDIWVKVFAGEDEEPVTHIWDGEKWLVTADFSFVEEMNTSIVQTSEQIKNLATKKEVDSISGKVTEIETATTQTAEKLETIASDQEDLQTQVSQTAQKVEIIASDRVKSFVSYDQPPGNIEVNVGDIWHKMSSTISTWQELLGSTWKQVQKNRWGEICDSSPKTYTWDGNNWIETASATPEEVKNSSVVVDADGIDMLGGEINMKAGTAIRVHAGSNVEIEGGSVEIKAGSSIKVESGGALDVESGTLNIKSGATMDVHAGGDLKIKSGGAMSVESGGAIDLKSGSTMQIESGSNLKIKSGATMQIESGGVLGVKSGSSVKIESGGTFEVDSDNFSVSKEGNVYMKDAVISGNLSQDGFSVLTKRNLIISSTEPTGSPDMVWVKPLSNVVLTYMRPISVNTSFSSFNSTKTLAIQGSVASATATTYRYTLRIPYRVVGAPLQVRTLTAKISNSSGSTVTMTGTLSNAQGYTGTLELTTTASFWLGDVGSLNLVITLEAPNTTEDYDYHQVTPGSIELICSAKSSAARGWTSAEVYVYQ